MSRARVLGSGVLGDGTVWSVPRIDGVSPRGVLTVTEIDGVGGKSEGGGCSAGGEGEEGGEGGEGAGGKNNGGREEGEEVKREGVEGVRVKGLGGSGTSRAML